MNKLIFIILFCGFVISSKSQTSYKTVSISKDLELIQLSRNIYVHVSYFESPEFGRFASNGMIFVSEEKAFLFDTPMTDTLTSILLSYIRNQLRCKVVGFICNDWHGDSMGGLAVIHRAGIPSWANNLTIEIAKSKGLPIPKHGFTDTLTLCLGNKTIFCQYLGRAHTIDNIIVWIPTEKLLFADCMVKEMKSINLGFTGDSDLKAYPVTLQKIKKYYSNAEIVIPGHGEIGGVELVDHTLKLAK